MCATNGGATSRSLDKRGYISGCFECLVGEMLWLCGVCAHNANLKNRVLSTRMFFVLIAIISELAKLIGSFMDLLYFRHWVWERSSVSRQGQGLDCA